MLNWTETSLTRSRPWNAVDMHSPALRFRSFPAIYYAAFKIFRAHRQGDTQVRGWGGFSKLGRRTWIHGFPERLHAFMSQAK